MVRVTGKSRCGSGFRYTLVQASGDVPETESRGISQGSPPPPCSRAGGSCSPSPTSTQGQVQLERLNVFSRNSPQTTQTENPEGVGPTLHGEEDWVPGRETAAPPHAGGGHPGVDRKALSTWRGSRPRGGGPEPHR